MTNITFIGVGILAQSLLSALNRVQVPAHFLLIAKDFEKLSKNSAGWPNLHLKLLQASSDISLILKSDILILTVKPAQIHDIFSKFPELSTFKGTVISFLAGIDSKTLSTLFLNATISRAMTSIGIQNALTPLLFWLKDGDQKNTLIEELFSSIGPIIYAKNELELDRDVLLYGCMPAVLATLLQPFKEKFIEGNLLATSEGFHLLILSAMEILKNNDYKNVIKKVQTPGGVTQAAIEHLESKNVFQELSSSIEAAGIRAKEISLSNSIKK